MASGSSIEVTAEKKRDNLLPTTMMKVGSALLYAAASILIMLVNKSTLTVYGFPSVQVLGLGQMVFGIVLIGAMHTMGMVAPLPPPNMGTVRKLSPLPLIYLANLICGLGGTKALSLPMLTVLRRFSIVMTMMGEMAVLNATFSSAVKSSVFVMILGALIAAANDLSFNVAGYTYVLLNDFFTAANGVITKKKLDMKELGKYGIIFYNSLLMIIPATMFAFYTGELQKAAAFPLLWDFWFQVNFLSSCGMGFLLMYSIVLCTQNNSALTTTVVGCAKNVFIAYFGMIFGGDYIFSWPNFIGLTISVIGSLIYAFANLKSSNPSTSINNSQKV